MQDEFDGVAAAGTAQVIVELAAMDAEDGAGALPARSVAGIAAVSEVCGNALKGGYPGVRRPGARCAASRAGLRAGGWLLLRRVKRGSGTNISRYRFLPDFLLRLKGTPSSHLRRFAG